MTSNESTNDTATPAPTPTLAATPTATTIPTASPTATPTDPPTETASPTPNDAVTARTFVRDLAAGEFEETAGVERTTADGNPVAVVTARCAEADQPVRCAFDAAGAIAGLLFPAQYAPPAYADESAFTERCEDPPSRSSRHRSHVSDGSLDRCGQFPPPAIGRSGPRILLPAPALWLAR